MSLRTQPSQSGLRASQTRRPCQMTAMPAKIQSSWSSVSVRSRSILTGSVARAEAEALGQALDVGVDDDAAGDAEGFAKDDVGGLAGDAAETQEFGHGAGDFAVKVVDQLGGGLANGAGFAAEEAGLADDFLDLELGGGCQGRGAWGSGGRVRG